MMITELIPNVDARKSFYHKAVVHSDGNNSKLYSYTTLVASHENGKTTVYLDSEGEFWSATTWRHVREYLYGIHGKVYTKKEAIANFA